MHGELLLSTDHSLDTIVHVLNQVNFGSAEASSVGNIENTVVSLTVLSMDTSDLNEVFIGDTLEHILLLSEQWKFDVNRSSKCSAKVSRARSNVA